MVKDTIKKKLHWGGSQKVAHLYTFHNALLRILPQLLDRKCRARCRLEYHRRSDAGETKTQTMLSLARRHNCCQNTIKRALINRYAIPDNLDSDGDYASDIESDDSVGSNEFRFRVHLIFVSPIAMFRSIQETQSPKASSPVDEVSKTRPYHGMNLAAEAENRTHHDRVNFRVNMGFGLIQRLRLLINQSCLKQVECLKRRPPAVPQTFRFEPTQPDMLHLQHQKLVVQPCCMRHHARTLAGNAQCRSCRLS